MSSTVFDLDQLGEGVKRDDFVGLAFDTLNYIATLVGGSTSGNAANVLTVLRVVLKTLQESHKGEITPDQCRRELVKLLDAIAETDADIDTAIKKKFHHEKADE